jgi:GntR family transcriptional regulator/MocR family aminotransferase
MTIFHKDQLKLALDVPLYQQLYMHLQAAILSGELRTGTKLPSTRELADEFNISRNTVLNAYRQLIAEGYLESITGSGTFVAHVLPDLLLTTPGITTPLKERVNRAGLGKPSFSKHASLQLTVPQMAPSGALSKNGLPRPFSFGMPALNSFPYELWSQLVIRSARRMPVSAFKYQDASGYRPLREAIAAHVTISRRVHCTPEQIVIVSGAQGGLDLASRMLINDADPVWMEDPGYFGAHGAFRGAGADIIPIPVDNEGLVVEEGIVRAPQARLVYITPSHQFPLGVTMSLTRRLMLLDWAKRANAYILEDDYDSEYRFSGRPLSALQGLDNAECVIYIGTFSKVLFPALRIGFLILPTSLVDAFLSVRRLMDVHTPILEQAVLADFIAEGHFRRHLRRMRTLYAERRDALLDAARKLPLDIYAPEAGVHCIAWLPDGLDDITLVRKAMENGLNLWPLSKFCLKPLERKGLVLGFGEYSVQEIRDGVRRLAAAMRST